MIPKWFFVVVEFTFKQSNNFQVTDIELCGTDFITVKDGEHPTANTLMTLTSSSVSGTMTISTGNRVYIYMKLDHHLKCRGVLLQYKRGI